MIHKKFYLTVNLLPKVNILCIILILVFNILTKIALVIL